MLGESRLQQSRDDLYVKRHDLSEQDGEHLREELRLRVARTRERLSSYQRLRQRHHRLPVGLSLRRRGVYPVLVASTYQCEQYLRWLGEAQQLLATHG